MELLKRLVTVVMLKPTVYMCAWTWLWVGLPVMVYVVLLQEHKTASESFVKRYKLTRLPPYLILCIKVSSATGK